MQTLFEHILNELDRMIADVRFLMAQQPDPQLNRAYTALTTCRLVFRLLAAEARAIGGQG